MSAYQLATKEDLAYAAKKQKETFVAKEASKDLITQTERDKLAGIAEGANKYTHPTTHPASMIEQDANNRFMTDTEKAALTAAKTHADSTHAPSGAQVNVIESIKRNGVTLTVTSKGVDITVPTKTSEISNDSGYQTAAQVQAEVTRVESIAKGASRGLAFDTKAQLDSWLAGTYTRPDGKIKADLQTGDNLYLKELGVPDYWWDGAAIQKLETEKVDLSGYVTSSEFVEITKAEIDAMYA